MSKYRVMTDQGAFEVTTDDASPTLAEAVGPGQEANARNFALATGDPRATQGAMADPVFMAKAIPTIAGVAGGLSPVPGGAIIGTVGGRQISNEMLRLMGKEDQIPSTGSQVLEGGLSAVADALPIPMVKKTIAGNAIGEAEKAAGLGAIEKVAPPSGIRTAIKLAQQINDKGTLTPEEAKSLKPAIDSIWQKGWLSQNAYKQYAPDVASASSKISQALNSIPGRAGPSADMAKAMTVPNAISSMGRAINNLPFWAKLAGGTAAGVAGGDALKQSLGGH